jgi:hypothetical protein
VLNSYFPAGHRPAIDLRRITVPAVLSILLAGPHRSLAQEPKPPEANPFALPVDAKKPEPIPEYKPLPALRTVPVPHDRPAFNVHMVSAALHHRDKQGIWVLDFSFKPIRIITVDIPNKGRRQIHYLYYRVVNRTGSPRMFVPQFIMVNEQGKRLEDSVLAEAIPAIQAREDPTIPLSGAVNIMGMIPASTKPDVDDAVFGVAVWETWDARSDRYSIYVRGLSDGYKEVPGPGNGKPVARYKTLRIDFIRRGDELHLSEKEIELSDPPYEWVYW